MKNLKDQTEVKRQPRWMIVDDQQDVLSLVRDIAVRFNDVDIQCFDSPQDAAVTFEAEPEAFEFVITDLEMPVRNGVELCRRRRAFSPLWKILLSLGSEIVSDEEAMQKGFCRQFRKPFPFRTLQHALKPACLKYAANSLVLTLA
jgi:DNA-binding NtrC family response regulator